LEPLTMPTYFDLPRPEVLQAIPRGVTSLLDVGCFEGGFGAALKVERNAFVWGVEQDRRAASVAARRLDRVTVGTFPQAIPNRAFDCITFLDSLEHMEDPWTALRQAHELLTRHGTVVASIPNVQHFSVIAGLIRGHFAYTDAGILDRTHLRFFTKRTIVDLFEGSGFAVTSVIPLHTDPSSSRLGRLLSWGGDRTLDFRAMQYLVKARSDS
jgi:2-polyprenyl-3-methyl-5-hydroxy-6-metoxy-1,4-benzoquinol methylase